VLLGQLPKLYKADLHCHSLYSGRAKHLRFLRCRDCYSQPLEVYRTAKRRGMDLVTITDHDSIDGCLETLNKLGDLPDFLTGEEVSAHFPAFHHTAHIAVYGLTEAHHRDIQKLRSNGVELVAYLRQAKLLFALNHLFHDFSDRPRVLEFIELMAELFDVFEVRNGSQQREHNTLIAKLVERFRLSGRALGMIAGSDAHTLRRLGRTYTASPARNREEFLQDIRAGRTAIFGAHSNHLSLMADIYGVVLRYYPAVLSIHNREFSPPLRVKNFALSVLAAPFLFVPYVAAVRHSHIERTRVNAYARLIESQHELPSPIHKDLVVPAEASRSAHPERLRPTDASADQTSSG
jgi:predicted metal-dependent phosphoesterase TrpH